MAISESRATLRAGRSSLQVAGLVQGVGFRPFVARLASELGLGGFVGNDSARVFLEVEGPVPALDEFCRRLVGEAPPLARIESIQVTSLPPIGTTGFVIVESHEADGAVTVVSPDVAVCAECLAEMADPADRRYGHPFITCTNCGPRFTIVRRLPYDRQNTTMSGFAMCQACRREYENPENRRYHAQPIGCHECGPTLSWRSAGGGEAGLGTLSEPGLADSASVLAAAQEALRDGAIVAVKGIGGYHLACDATSDAAVGTLRARKNRADKPFAVMVADLDQARALAEISAREAELLESPARPIVLVRSRAGSGLSPLVAPGNPLIGLLLPNAPLHHLLFVPQGSGPSPGGGTKRDRVSPRPGRLGMGPLVMTSGNRGGEPICFRDGDLERRLGSLVDGALAHDRPIHVPCDDSVVRIVGDKLMAVRRSRGYAPLPVQLPVSGPDVLAVGGELKNTFCVTSGTRAWVSQHIGDLENMETLEAFEASVRQYCDLYRVEPEVVAADAHPGYLASAWARRHNGALLEEVYHHHAHVASVMAEHGVDPERKVIGFAFDGTGYGADGTIWGGEVLVADGTSFVRAFHLREAPLPGGDAGVRHPCRVALAQLWASGIEWPDQLPPVVALGSRERALLVRQLEANVACVPTSSMGRLFDAVSSIVGLRHHISYEAQAAIELEVAAARTPPERACRYAFAVEGDTVDPRPVLSGIVADVGRGVAVGSIAAGFHRAVAAVIVELAERVREATGLMTVALSGGVFQNALLAELAVQSLSRAGFETLLPRLVPPNDGGLALGQAFVALARRRHPGQGDGA